MLTMSYVLYAFGMIFLVCELCTRASDAFEEINDMIGTFDWYLFPDNINRLLPTIIILAQQSVMIDCFGSLGCNRDGFKRVSFIQHIGKNFFYQFWTSKLNLLKFFRLSMVDFHILWWFVSFWKWSRGFLCRFQTEYIYATHVRKYSISILI